MHWNDRVDTALSWFVHPKTPTNLVMLYIEEPDTMGHMYGPESDVVSLKDLQEPNLKTI